MPFDRAKPVSIENHNHSFDEHLRCICGVTWEQQSVVPVICSKDARGRNERDNPPLEHQSRATVTDVTAGEPGASKEIPT